MSELSDSLHVAVVIRCEPNFAYEFIRDPRNLPKWATGLGSAIEQVDGEWVAESAMGRLTIQFAPANEFGVVDHLVTLASGEGTNNPMRVLPHHRGCEVVFALQRAEHVSTADFEADAAAIRTDLGSLRTILEDAAA